MTPERNEFLVLVNVKKHNTLVKAGETDHLNPFKHQNVKALRQSKSYGCSKKVRAFLSARERRAHVFLNHARIFYSRVTGVCRFSRDTGKSRE